MRGRDLPIARLLLGGVAMLCALPAQAQRSSENAVTEAEDAFGTTVGRETIGLYDPNGVRGFSPTTAGNVRIEGLYFDQVFALSSRVRRSATIRVGPSAQGYPFPAPTGIVDYGLRKPGGEASLGLLAGGDSYRSGFIEADGVVPIDGDRLSLGLGASLAHSEYFNGTDTRQDNEAVMLAWRPAPGIEVLSFWSRFGNWDDEFGPHYIPTGDKLPAGIPLRRFDGPDWAAYRGYVINTGTIASADLGDWTIRAGGFRSIQRDRQFFSHYLTGLTADPATGLIAADRTIFADPPSKAASNSGEIRVSRKFAEGDRLHIVHLNLRGRDRGKTFGGSDLDVVPVADRPTVVGRGYTAPRPTFDFDPLSRDSVKQWSAGVAYEGKWRGLGEISLGLQKTDYSKSIIQPGLAPTETEAAPWLYNAGFAINITPQLAAYAGYTKGLEESGIAPGNASNRNEALPAIITSQRDAGLRFAVNEKLSLVAGVFDVRKPYFNLDQAGTYALLGDVKHQGVELSLSGGLTDRLDIVTGAVLLRARVTGEGVELGRVGKRPVGRAARNLELNLDWRPPVAEGLSFDLGVSHTSRTTATTNNRVYMPARTLVGLGGRYRFKLGDTPASLRVAVSNLFDVYGFELRGSGVYELMPGRLATAYLTVDL